MSESSDDAAASPSSGHIDFGTRLILEAFRLHRITAEQTRAHRDLRHDADLLPQINDRLYELLSCIPADQHIEYDVQGLRDQGTDIVVRFSAGTRQSFVCIQVKSHKELEEADLVAKLRVQHSESVDHYGEKALWCVALSADVSAPSKKIDDRLRAIRKAFAKKARTYVLDPTNLGGFLNLNLVQMTSLVTMTLRSDDDPIIADARADSIRYPMQSAVLLDLVATDVAGRHRYPTYDGLAQSAWLQAVSESLPWNPAYDGPALILPTPLDDSPEEWPDSDLPAATDEPNWNEVDLWAPPVDVLAWALRPAPPSQLTAAGERLLTRLPAAIDSLVASRDIAISSDGRIAVAPRDHPALFALASEAMVRFGLSADELRSHIVEVLLPVVTGDSNEM